MVVWDALRAVVRRWQRNLLMATAVAMSAAAVVVLVAFVHTAAHRTALTLTALSADAIRVTLPGAAWGIPEGELLRQVRGVPQIIESGTIALPGDSSGAAVTVRSLRGGVSARAGVAVATRSGLAARGASVVTGAQPSPVEEVWPTSVMLGRRLATELGIADPRGAVIDINGVPMGVAAIVADGEDGSILAASVIVEPIVARRLGLLPATRSVLIRVTPGTAPSLAPYLPAALYPSATDQVAVAVPPSPRKLQEQLAAESTTWVSVITAVLVGVSGFMIVTTMQIAVQERRREIGIRRAMGTGATRIAAQFCCEALVIGGLASLIGGALGAIGLSLWAAIVGWVVLMPTFLTLVPVAGVVIGGVSGLIPAHLATRVDPSELLRTT